MAIITQTEVEGRIGSAEVIRLTDDAVSGSVNAAILARVISDAEGEVLGRIAQAYTLPLGLADVNTSAMVKTALLDVVVYRLALRRPPVAEDFAASFKAAIAWADKIASGSLGLAGETELAESVGQGGNIVVDSTERVIDRDSMAGL
jgi:phage gp36-like protein